MNENNIILTGAGGGIGRELACLLDKAGAQLTLVDINEKTLTGTTQILSNKSHKIVIANLTDSDDIAHVISTALEQSDTIDVLINCAGINPFGVFEAQDSTLVRKTIEINMLAPLLLTHHVLPHMKRNNSGHIVNIGSTFGSIGFAWFTAYSASKFGLRGFSQALRRELSDTNIDVTYVAPRAVNTPINSQYVYRMAAVTKMKFDEPPLVAREIMKAIMQKQKERYIGFPESLFVRINAIIPGLVDFALKQQNSIAKAFALNEKTGT